MEGPEEKPVTKAIRNSMGIPEFSGGLLCRPRLLTSSDVLLPYALQNNGHSYLIHACKAALIP